MPRRKNLFPSEPDKAPEMDLARMIAADTAFRAAVMAAHPGIVMGISTQPCTESPRVMPRPAVLRSGDGFDYLRGE